MPHQSRTNNRNSLDFFKFHELFLWLPLSPPGLAISFRQHCLSTPIATRLVPHEDTTRLDIVLVGQETPLILTKLRREGASLADKHFRVGALHPLEGLSGRQGLLFLALLPVGIGQP